MKAFRWRFLACGLVCLISGPVVSAAEPISVDQFNKVHTLIKPDTRDEKWTKVPWMVSLWQARQKAAELGKPILLWEMDGHPLGCT